MESLNNTFEADNGNSSVDQESLPSTTSVLDKSRSLFGNSSAVLSTPARDPTPDCSDGGNPGDAAESSVAMETVKKAPSSAETPSDEINQSSAQKEEEDNNGNAEGIDHSASKRSELPKAPEVPVRTEVEEEVFEKKVVSMDTSNDDGASEQPVAESIDQEDDQVVEREDGEEKEQKIQESEEVEQEEEGDDEEDDETPKKKAKRVASHSEDDEVPADDVEENAEETKEAEEEVDANDEFDSDNSKKTKETETEQPTSARSTRSKRSSTSAAATPTSSTTTPRSATRGKGSRGAKKEEDSEEAHKVEVEDVAEKEEGNTSSKRGSRARRSTAAAASSAVPTPRSGRGRARKETEKTEEPAAANEDQIPQTARTPRSRRSAVKIESEKGDADEKEEDLSKKTARTPRSRKSTNKLEEQEKEDEEKQPSEGEAEKDEEESADAPTSSTRRSARAKPVKSASSTPVTSTSNKRTPRIQRKRQVSIAGAAVEEADEPVESTPAKKGRGASKGTPSASGKKTEYDPYDLETEMEHHPEPLKNIHMEVQNFGGVKYAKAGTSESKYSMTEKAAESRLADLQASPSSKNRRSLADMTPGKEKIKHKTALASASRKSRAKKDERHDNDVTMENIEEVTSPDPPTSTNRGKKRKSEASDLKSPAAKKQPEIVLKELSDEEQLQVDHPQDDHEPHAPGARVYAVFQKTFYPAIILSERDGLGRYKLQFTADKVVKDVPNSGIIPIRALSAGKIAIFEENDVRLDEGPDDISAAQWVKGKVKITILDDEDEPTDEMKVVDWTEVSFDQSEWREYIKMKEQSSTSIATSNITTISEASRARKTTSAAKKPLKPKTKVANKKKEEEVSLSRAESITPEDDDEILPMNENAVGKNIFEGKVFMLTSANRSNAAETPSMFKKKNLITFITQNGGIVTESLTSIQERYPDHETLLISDTYYRTHKFLAALAKAIPCVNNTWLQVCGEKGECVDYKDFVLPAGASIFTELDMPAPENPSELLKGRKIYVHSTHSKREVTQFGPGGTFVDIWRPIVQLLGAEIVEADWETLEETKTKFDILLVDGTFRNEVMEYADKINAGKVTSEWVIQTIILSDAPEPTAHPKFDPYRLHHRTRH